MCFALSSGDFIKIAEKRSISTERKPEKSRLYLEAYYGKERESKQCFILGK
jgi:hypothetical protein